MGRYGQTAVLATEFFCAEKTVSPPEAWKDAAKSVFADSISSQVKGCPRSTYLGLCEAGLVQGVPAGVKGEVIV